MQLTLKKFFLTTALSLTMLTGCQTSSNTLTFTVPTPTAINDISNQSTFINVATHDLRSNAEIARYNDSGKLQLLTSSPSVSQLFQQAMIQNLTSKGFSIVTGAGNINIATKINTFKADISQGNLRYKVNAQVGVEVIVQGSRGTFNKHFNTARGYEGAFGVNNDEIQKVLTNAYNDAVQAIYNDHEIINAIHQFK